MTVKTAFRTLQDVDVTRLIIKSKAIPGCEGVNAEVSAALWPSVASRIGVLEIVVDAEDGGRVKEEDVQDVVPTVAVDKGKGKGERPSFLSQTSTHLL